MCNPFLFRVGRGSVAGPVRCAVARLLRCLPRWGDQPVAKTKNLASLQLFLRLGTLFRPLERVNGLPHKCLPAVFASQAAIRELETIPNRKKLQSGPLFCFEFPGQL